MHSSPLLEHNFSAIRGNFAHLNVDKKVRYLKLFSVNLPEVEFYSWSLRQAFQKEATGQRTQWTRCQCYVSVQCSGSRPFYLATEARQEGLFVPWLREHSRFVPPLVQKSRSRKGLWKVRVVLATWFQLQRIDLLSWLQVSLWLMSFCFQKISSQYLKTNVRFNLLYYTT